MSGPSLARPNYDPSTRSPGIVHLGVGNFHRAHQAVYVDDMITDDGAAGWGITGVNLVPGGGVLLEAIRRRGMRYVLKTTTHQSELSYREIASILDCVDLIEEEHKAVSLLADKEVRLVTLTVTGGGYKLVGLEELDTGNKDVQADLAGEGIRTIYGYLRSGLAERKAAGAGPLTVLSCDNVRGNGHMLRKAMEQFLAEAGEASLAGWVSDNVSFPCAMVDRITPVTPPGLSKEVEESFGIAGDPSLMSEKFIQWVIEDDFAGERPPLDKVGVVFTSDVLQYEEAKIRILNGGHSSIGYLSALLGHEHVWQAMQDDGVVSFFDAYLTEEVIPAIKDTGVIDLPGYHEMTKQRFSNPNLDDTIARICRRGSTKVPEFIAPTISGTLEQGRMPRHGLSIIACWYELMRRCAQGGGPIKYEDSGWDLVKGHLAPGGEEAFARDTKIWGSLPERHPKFVDALVERIKEGVNVRDLVPMHG